MEDRHCGGTTRLTQWRVNSGQSLLPQAGQFFKEYTFMQDSGFVDSFGEA